MMGKDVKIDEDVLKQYQAVVEAARNFDTNHIIQERLQALDIMLDPYRKSKDDLVLLLIDGIEERGQQNLGSDERELIAETVEEIFSGSDWTQELVMAMLRVELPKIAVGDSIFGLFNRASLLETLEKRFFGAKDPNQQLANNITANIRPRMVRDEPQA